MIKIFIESGVNAAQKHDKETTNEQDFIVKVIAKHFPKCQYKKDFDGNYSAPHGMSSCLTVARQQVLR